MSPVQAMGGDVGARGRRLALRYYVLIVNGAAFSFFNDPLNDLTPSPFPTREGEPNLP
jgi:hypothetical protein